MATFSNTAREVEMPNGDVVVLHNGVSPNTTSNIKKFKYDDNGHITESEAADAEDLNLSGYSTPTTGTTAIGTSDDIQTAIGKLDHQSQIDQGNIQSILDGTTIDSFGDVETALSNKVDKVTGKGLSSNDYTNDEKNKLSNIQAGAEVNVQADWNQSTSTADSYIKNKPTLGTAAAANTTDFATAAQGTKADNAIPSSAKGTANGVASLDSSGKVPSSQLPSYVDDVLEYSSKSSFPSSGESGKIYVDTTTNKTYRWGGSAYVEISESLALGDTASTAYYGDRGKTAYEHATDSSRVTSAIASGLYKVAATAQGHIASLSAITKADITNLGIPGTDTNTHRPIKVDGTQLLGDNTTALNIVAGGNVTLTPDTSAGKVTIAATDTNTHRPIQVNGTEILGNNTTVLNLKEGSNVDISNSGGTVTIAATDTNTYVSSAAFADNTSSDANNPLKLTLSRSGSVTTDVTGTLPKVSSSSAGVVPKGTAVSSQSQSTKFLREDGTWAKPSYTTNTNTTYTFASGSTNGAFSVTPSGGSVQSVPIYGLKSAAYTDSSEYAASIHTHTKSQITDFPTSMTPTSHTHGNIQNGGTLQTNDITIASGDKLVVTDNSDSSKIARASISFDGSTTTQALTKAGTWATFGTSNLTLGTSSTQAAAGNHTHGNITNAGALQSTDVSIANGDKLVVTDASDSNKVARTSVAFDGSTATKCLTQKGTFETFGTSNLTLGTSSSQAAAGNHTHGLSIAGAASGSSADVNLSANTIYTLTAGGKTYNFKTPADNNSNTIACAYCDTAAGTAAKTASCSGYALLDKSYLIVTITNTNSSASALTLNVNGKGAKSIYINGSASSSSNYTLPAGTYIVYYSTNYYFRTDGKVTTAGMVDIGGNTTKYFRGDGTLADPPGTYSLPTASGSQFGGVKIGSNISNNSGTISLSSTNVTDALGYTPLSSHQTIKQDGVSGATVNRFGTCGTAAGTAAKTVSITTGTFTLEAGARVTVKFSNANTAGTPTLNVNSTGAKNIYNKGSQITTGGNKALLAGTVDFIYDGTQYHLIGNYIDTNTTYSSKSAASGGTDVSLVTTGEKYTWNNKGNGTVTSVKVGSTSYNPSSGVVSLPAYPTTDSALNGGSTNAVQNKVVTQAITQTIDNGFKNLCPYKSLDLTSSTGWDVILNLYENLPAGEYAIQFVYTSTSTSQVYVDYSDGTSLTITPVVPAGSSSTIGLGVVATKPIKSIRIYHNAGIILENILFCTWEDYSISTYYSPGRVDTNALLPIVYPEYVKPTKHSNITSIDSGGYVQIGKLVIVNMRFTVGTACGQYTDLFTDLPLPLTPLSGGSACVACASNNNSIMICANGRMQNYDSGSLSTGVCVVSAVYMGQ